MAAGSLGRLTLDLAVRLSEFTDGLSRADRETRERTESMGESVRTFRDQMMEDLGGTQLGGAIDTLNSRLESISGGGMMAGAALAGMAVGGIAVATGALVTMALETAKADVQLQVMATTANVGLRSFQVLTHAAAGLGVEQDALAGILADVQEKLGEFSATGGGGAADFFEALQNNTKMTDEEIRNLGKTLQGKDGAEAIQLIKNEMDALGATSQEQRFVFESLAGDLGNLMPLFADGGDILNKYGKELDDAGVIKTKEAIDESRKLAAQTQAIQTKMEGLKTQLVTEMIPALGTLTNYFTEGTTKGKGFRNEVNNVGSAIRTTAALVVGLAGGISIIAEAFMQVGAQMRNIGETATAFFDAEGIVAKGKVLAVGFTKTALIGADGYMSVTQKYEKTIKTINQLMLGQQAALTGLAGANNDLLETTGDTSKGLALNTVEFEANAKAREKQAAAAEKNAKANAKAAAAAKSATHIQYANQSATRNKAIAPELISALSFLQEEGIVFKVTSGGQGAKGSGAKRVGSTAHDNGRAADGDLYKNGRKLDWNNSKDLPLLKSIVEEAAARGINGIGAGNDYMGAGRFHFGIQSQAAAWGKDGRSANVMAWLKEAYTAGSQRKASNTFYGKAIADDIKVQEQADKEALRQHEEILRRQGSITAKYATDREKIESDHLANVAEIKDLYAEGSAERTELLAREELDYIEKKNAGATSILVKYLEGEAKLKYEHEQAIKAIEMANIEDDDARQALINLQNEAYQEDLANFRFAANAKAREQDKLYQSIANSIKANRSMAASDGLDRMAQRTMSEDDYAVWRLAQDHDESYNSVNTQYADRQSEINARDERDNFLLPELERNELLEIARQEHLDAMWAMEQDHALKQQTLDKQMADKKVAIQEMAFSSMTSVAAMFFGENSRMHQAAFVMERAFAVQKALMNVKETYSNTFNAISAIPLVGPYLAMPAAVAASALQVAQAAGISGMSAPSVAGIAHGGLDYVPKESTYLLDQGERVLSPRQNKDLAAFMEKGHQSSTGNIIINNNSSAEVTARRAPNGEVTVEMVDKMIEKSFRRIGSPNSVESKSIQRGTTARVNRR